MTAEEISPDAGTIPLEPDALLQAARQRAGLTDIGPKWIVEPFEIYVRALRTEAHLTPGGAAYMSEMIIRRLVNRLRMIEAIRLHPEILEEELIILAAIVGLPRTGSTMLQRVLTSVPGINGVRWWELQNFSPFPGEIPGQPVERIQFAEKMVEAWLAATPEFATIHPLSATQVDEESILLHNMFAGMLEYAAPAPSFVAWQNTTDFRATYADLRTELQFLQWQEPTRRGRPWLLKAPEHMIAPEAMLEIFPGAKVIITHRDPVQVLPSICSMHYTIQKLAVDEPDRMQIGRSNLDRWATALERLTALRERVGDDRFIDVSYGDLLKDPVGEARKALTALGLTLDAQGEAAVNAWLAENARDQRASHVYTAADFGLDEREMEAAFANYSRRFIAA
jgi:hypothetical protein